MAGSGNSCTLSCWRPPAAVRVSAFMQRDGSERGAQDLLARVERNRDSGATGRRRLQEETEFHPAFRSVGDLADKVCQPVSLPRNGEGGRGILRLEQLEDPAPALAISREGDRLAYLIGKIADAAKGRVEFSLFLQSTAPGSSAVSVPLNPGEQVLSPSF